MARVVSIALLSFLALTGQAVAQQVFIARDPHAGPPVTSHQQPAPPPAPKEKIAKAEPVKQTVAKAEPVKPPVVKAEPIKQTVAKAEPVKPPVVKAEPVKERKEPVKVAAAKPRPEKEKPIVEKIKAQPMRVAMVKAQDLAEPSQRLSGAVDTAFTKLADGFDFPIGKPDAEGYYKARGFRAQGAFG